MLAPDDWVPLGVVGRPHGVRGELRVQTFNRDSELLLSVDEVLVRRTDGSEDECSVDGARATNGAILMKLYSVDDRDRADSLKGALICARRRDFPELPDGEFYVCDVEGARVVVEGSPEDLGRVREIRTYPSVSTLVVEAADGGAPWEVPLVEAVVRSVDVLGSVVTLATLEGIERG